MRACEILLLLTKLLYVSAKTKELLVLVVRLYIWKSGFRYC